MSDPADDSVSQQERDLAEAVARITGRRPRIIPIPPPHYGPPPATKEENEHA